MLLLYQAQLFGTASLNTSETQHYPYLDEVRLSTYGRRAFAIAGPTMFNTLPDILRDPAVSTSTFGQSLKTHLFICLSARLAH